MDDDDIPESLKMTISRLYSQDANDRVKAAGELGEIGIPEIAPKLLKVVYEDEASTVRQMAIQSYGEILGDEAVDDLVHVSTSHFDEYVRMYAMNTLGNIPGTKSYNAMLSMLEDENPRLQATALRAMIHAETKDLAEKVFEKLKNTEDELIERNCIEALALWRYKAAREYINEKYFNNQDLKSLELKTIAAFYLAVFGDKSSRKFIENERIDTYIRIVIDDIHFKGNKGLLDAINRLK